MRKKVIIFPFAFILCISAVAQNVGVGLQTLTTPSTFTSHYYVNGMDGTPTTVTFIQGASSIFYKVFTGGVGGVAPFSGQHTRAATSYISIPGTTAEIRSIHVGATGPDFGSGGTPDVFAATSGGGSGRIIIYY